MGESGTPPPGMDMTRPNIARVYDYLLGGKDNFAADREVAELILRVLPDAKDGPRSNRAFLRRAVRYLAADAGIGQFLDIGSGLPTRENVHEMIQETTPAARVAYVDYDPVVLAHARALLATDYTSVIMADIREPRSILDHPAVRKVIDFDQPVGLLVLSTLHHLNDEDDPAGIMATLRNAMPPGSHLVISHLHNPGSERPEDAELARVGEEIFQNAYGTGRWRSAEAIRGFFGDWDLLPPGLVQVVDWRPNPAEPRKRSIINHFLLAGVARKP